MDADFNTPDALAVIFDLAREINTLRARDSVATSAPPTHLDLDRRRRTLVYLLGVLGLDLSAAQPSEAASVGPLVELTLDIRGKLRDINATALVGAAVLAMVIFPLVAQSLLLSGPRPAAEGGVQPGAHGGEAA